MQFSENNFLMRDHFFLDDNATQKTRFLICLFKLPSFHLSRVITAAILFLQFRKLDPSSCPGTVPVKN